MVDFNWWKCRNCKHYHGLRFDVPCDKYLEPNADSVIFGYCACNKFESNDNLVFLEDKYVQAQQTRK